MRARAIFAALFFCTSFAASPSSFPGVTLQQRGLGEKVLVAAKSFAAGDVVVAIPRAMCLLVRRDGSVFSGLRGQLDDSLDDPCIGDLRAPVPADAAPELSWDVRLAFAVLDATAGTSVAESGEFYDAYAFSLQPPETLCLPLCMSEWMLAQLQNPVLHEAAAAQQRRLAKVAGMYGDVNAHRVTAAAWQRAQRAHSDARRLPPPLSPLQWGFALVRSRCFKASDDTFAFVPLIDMANHATRPAAQFEAADTLQAFCLRATRDLTTNDEVTISYDNTYTNDRLMVQYGFTVENNPNDDVFDVLHLDGVNDAVKQAASERVVGAADTLPRDGANADTARVHAATRSLLSYISALPSSGSSSSSSSSRSASSVLDVLEAAADAAIAAYPTSLVNDRRLLKRLTKLPPGMIYVPRTIVDIDNDNDNDAVNDSGEPGPLDNAAHLRACVRYRCEKKERLAAVKGLLMACRRVT